MRPPSASAEHAKASARDWFARMVLEQPSEDTRRAFEAWRAEDPSHDDSYSRYARLWNETAGLKETAWAGRTAAVVDPTDIPRRASSRWSRTSLLAASLAAVGVLTWQIHARMPADFSTAIGESREIALSDGTSVSLGAGSRIRVWLSGSERRAALTAGEAFFDVAPDATRPFLIDVGKQRVRVVGTKFDIRRADESVRVSVLEGAVQVMSSIASEHGANHTLHAGEQLDADTASAAVLRVGSIGSADPFAWRKGRLVYADAPLREVIADANRYSPQQYVIHGEALADKRVSVAYSTGQVVQMVNGLAEAIPFRFKQISAHQVEIDADDSASR